MDFDYLVIGAGISGAASAYELAAYGKTLIVDMESTGAFHSTGRSAALYTPNYGPSLVRKINKLSATFLESPQTDFCENSLLSPRGMMKVIPNEHANELDSSLTAGSEHLELISAHKAVELAPFLRAEMIHAAVYEKGVYDMDVNALHQGFLRGFKQRGGTVMFNTQIKSLNANSQGWKIELNGTHLSVHTIVNAAGAWADVIGALANAKPIGLQPMRRTAILIDAPVNTVLSNVPAIDFAGTESYLKPESQQLMVSPGDVTPVAAQDIQVDDLDVAKLVDWLERTTSINVRRINHQWAGLRSFTASGTPVAAFDPDVPNFFWLAGQGGYGIMMAPALGRASASLITTNGLPQDFIDVGIDASALSVQ